MAPIPYGNEWPMPPVQGGVSGQWLLFKERMSGQQHLFNGEWNGQWLLYKSEDPSGPAVVRHRGECWGTWLELPCLTSSIMQSPCWRGCGSGGHGCSGNRQKVFGRQIWSMNLWNFFSPCWDVLAAGPVSIVCFMGRFSKEPNSRKSQIELRLQLCTIQMLPIRRQGSKCSEGHVVRLCMEKHFFVSIALSCFWAAGI